MKINRAIVNKVNARSRAANSAKINISNKLKNKKIGISISNSENIYELGFSDMHRDDAMIEIARYLLVQGSTLVYGGDLRSGGYTLLLSELSYQYRAKEDRNKIHVINYSSYPIYRKITREQENEFIKNRVDFKPIKPPKPFKVRKYFDPVGNDNKYIWAESLTKMRKQMIKMCDARILMGGKLSGYSGRIPGIVEESMLSLEHNKPTFIIGAFGGASQAVAKCLLRENCEELTENWQFKDKKYKEFVEYYNLRNKSNKINYDEIRTFHTKYRLTRLSKNNGLTIEENRRLFNTIHIPEMIFLILKGLNKKLN